MQELSQASSHDLPAEPESERSPHRICGVNELVFAGRRSNGTYKFGNLRLNRAREEEAPLFVILNSITHFAPARELIRLRGIRIFIALQPETEPIDSATL